MDPDANLAEQLDSARRILSGEYANLDFHAERLAELVIALDEWIRGGGFVPSRWTEGQTK